MKLHKRILAMMLVLIFCLSVINASVYAAGGFENFTDRNHYTANTFQDVKKSDWFYSSVVTVYEKGLMNGKGNSRFDPDGYVTVAEAVTIAARLHTLYNTGNESFGTAVLWYEPYCKYAEKHGIIRRYSTNGITHEGAIEEKREENNVTRYWSTACTDNASRAFFASVLAKSLPTQALASINDLADDSLPDVVMTDQYAEEIYTLYRAGVITGSDAYGTFKPDYRITRREAAAIIARMIDTSQRKHLALAEATYIVTGYCGGNYKWEAVDGALGYTVGENLQYTLDLATGLLTVTGEGPMALFTPVWDDYASKICKVIIEDGVTSIGAQSFAGCTNLTSVELPDSITSIGIRAFEGCTSLESIRLPDQITQLPYYVFRNCSSLKEIHLPDKLEVVLEDKSFGCQLFANCTSLTSIILPDTLKNIGGQMFAGCKNLQEINIPSSLIYIGDRAFENCTNLPKLIIPDDVEIAANAFD